MQCCQKKKKRIKNEQTNKKPKMNWEFPGGPVVRTPLQGSWVQYLVEELRSHMPGGKAKNKQTNKQRIV